MDEDQLLFVSQQSLLLDPSEKHTHTTLSDNAGMQPIFFSQSHHPKVTFLSASQQQFIYFFKHLYPTFLPCSQGQEKACKLNQPTED